MSEFKLLKGDCLETLKTLEDNSIDAVVTDPPYGLEFMGKEWDAYTPKQFQQWCQQWASKCLRVLKPGGHILAFGGTRTYHRLTSAIEDAGFEIRDSIHWTYGSGFPKSLDVSKAIDKAAGAQREVVGKSDNGIAGGTGKHAGQDDAYGFRAEFPITAPATAAAQQWEGWGTALKPSHEPIVLARKPLIGTVANNVLTHGTGALNINASKVGSEVLPEQVGGQSDPRWVTVVPGKITPERTGRWPANTILTHSVECVEDCVPACPVSQLNQQQNNTARFYQQTQWTPQDHPPFIYQPKAGTKERNEGLKNLPAKFAPTMGDGIGQKPQNPETATKKHNTHPTVKPVKLMEYLITLITPPNGTVLDPFLGSGTTAVAALNLGFNVVGCEKTEEYYPIIEARTQHAQEQYSRKGEKLF